MPFYEYECQACKYYTEVMQKISDTPLTRCPSCGKRSLKKLVSVPVFRLKGAGWYETDFKSDKETKRNLLGAEKEESKAESKAEASESKSAESGAKEAKEARPAEPKSPKATSGASTAGRSRGTARSSAARRPVRAKSARKARKKRR